MIKFSASDIRFFDDSFGDLFTKTMPLCDVYKEHDYELCVVAEGYAEAEILENTISKQWQEFDPSAVIVDGTIYGPNDPERQLGTLYGDVAKIKRLPEGSKLLNRFAYEKKVPIYVGRETYLADHIKDLVAAGYSADDYICTSFVTDSPDRAYWAWKPWYEAHVSIASPALTQDYASFEQWFKQKTGHDFSDDNSGETDWSMNIDKAKGSLSHFCAVSYYFRQRYLLHTIAAVLNAHKRVMISCHIWDYLAIRPALIFSMNKPKHLETTSVQEESKN